MRNGIILDELKCVYWFVPKNACTTLKTYFANRIDLKYDGSVHDAKFKYTDVVQPEYFNFAFVRNPIDRIISLYKDKIVNEYSDYVFGKYGGRFYHKMPFVDFVNEVMLTDNKDPHFDLQRNQIPGMVKVYQMEDNILLKTLNKHNKSSEPIDEVLFKDYRKAEQMIYRIYTEDFIVFGYQ